MLQSGTRDDLPVSSVSRGIHPEQSGHQSFGVPPQAQQQKQQSISKQKLVMSEVEMGVCHRLLSLFIGSCHFLLTLQSLFF